MAENIFGVLEQMKEEAIKKIKEYQKEAEEKLNRGENVHKVIPELVEKETKELLDVGFTVEEVYSSLLSEAESLKEHAKVDANKMFSQISSSINLDFSKLNVAIPYDVDIIEGSIELFNTMLTLYERELEKSNADNNKLNDEFLPYYDQIKDKRFLDFVQIVTLSRFIHVRFLTIYTETFNLEVIKLIKEHIEKIKKEYDKRKKIKDIASYYAIYEEDLNNAVTDIRKIIYGDLNEPTINDSRPFMNHGGISNLYDYIKNELGAVSMEQLLAVHDSCSKKRAEKKALVDYITSHNHLGTTEVIALQKNPLEVLMQMKEEIDEKEDRRRKLIDSLTESSYRYLVDNMGGNTQRYLKSFRDGTYRDVLQYFIERESISYLEKLKAEGDKIDLLNSIVEFYASNKNGLIEIIIGLHKKYDVEFTKNDEDYLRFSFENDKDDQSRLLEDLEDCLGNLSIEQLEELKESLLVEGKGKK